MEVASKRGHAIPSVSAHPRKRIETVAHARRRSIELVSEG
jgi:hypothetical protein